jgi:hypothetical protein
MLWLKYILTQKLANKLAFLSIYFYFLQKVDQNIGIWENRQVFLQKIGKNRRKLWSCHQTPSPDLIKICGVALGSRWAGAFCYWKFFYRLSQTG